MNLLLDCGNTRLKWALTDAVLRGGEVRIVQRGAVGYAPQDLERLVSVLETVGINRVQYASVVAPEQEAAVIKSMAALAVVPERFCVTPQAGSLINAYATQQTLGVDRWAAAIGAWHMVGASCLVVSAGTATTIDLIEAVPGGAVYRGGLILPGIDLMLQSLHQRAARLPLAEGCYRAAPGVPDNTHDAMVSGVIDATCGAIERMERRLPGDTLCVLTGGGAMRLANALLIKTRITEDLVLEGLAFADQLGTCDRNVR